MVDCKKNLKFYLGVKPIASAKRLRIQFNGISLPEKTTKGTYLAQIPRTSESLPCVKYFREIKENLRPNRIRLPITVKLRPALSQRQFSQCNLENFRENICLSDRGLSLWPVVWIRATDFSDKTLSQTQRFRQKNSPCRPRRTVIGTFYRTVRTELFVTETYRCLLSQNVSFPQGMQLHRKAAEERLSGNAGGMSFLARQRQASSRRSTPNRTQQANAVSSR